MVLHVYERYRELLGRFVRNGYRFVTVEDAASEPLKPPFIVLRHDVEWDARRAVALADIEQELGVASTMYFRVDTRANDLGVMRELQGRGFVIGYHYNTLDRTRGDFDKARRLFEADLADLRGAGLRVRSAAPHGEPWRRANGYQFNWELLDRWPGLLADAQLIDVGHWGTSFPLQAPMLQISDANMAWNRGEITWDFFRRVARSRSVPCLFMLVHADYWSYTRSRAAILHSGALALRTLRLRSSAKRWRHPERPVRRHPSPAIIALDDRESAGLDGESTGRRRYAKSGSSQGIASIELET